MSELKSEKIYRQNMFGKIFTREVYEKSEADKEIAEKDAEIAQLQAMLEERNKQVGELKHSLELASNECCSISERTVKKLRYRTYKWCLAMAKMCDSEENRLEALSPIFDTDKEYWEYNSDYWARWHNRWQELAYKFKRNSTHQQKE